MKNEDYNIFDDQMTEILELFVEVFDKGGLFSRTNYKPNS